MTWTDWERNGWLKAHRTSATEIRDLLAVVDRDLHDSNTDKLSADWRLTIAYNAALQAATAALSAAGYRASRDQHHYRVIQSLEATIGAEPELIAVLDSFRKKRNIVDYERAGAVSDGEATEMRRLAIRIRDDVVVWLRQHHPNLLSSR